MSFERGFERGVETGVENDVERCEKSGAKIRSGAVRVFVKRDPKGARPFVRGVAASLITTLLTVLFMGIGPAFATASCDELLPDFRCDEDREARPKGHVAPMSMPYLFEDPYITTDLVLVGIYNNFPAHSIVGGGDAGVIALQARLAITDRLAFIATKDGYTISRPDHTLLDNEEGFMNITAGFKYAVIDDRESGLIVTPSFRYEVPLGNDGVFQGKGRGVAIPAISVGYGPENIHLIADLGAQIAADANESSSSLFYNIHLDQAFEVAYIPGADFLVPFIELNGMTWVNSGDGSNTYETDAGRLPIKTIQNVLHGAGLTTNLRGEGNDIINLGSSGVAGNTVITMAWGFWIPFRNGFNTGFSYERALSQREDLVEQRVTLMVSYDF